MSEKTHYEPQLPPYEVCIKSSYTKEHIDEFKNQLKNIENELLNIEHNNIRKPQLRRQAADLEEIIINYENTKPKPEIVQLLNDYIELLSEYVELEKYNVLDDDIIEKKIVDSLFIKDNDFPIRNDFSSRIICKSDLKLFTDHLKKHFPKYSNAFEKHCTKASIKMFESNSVTDTFDRLLSMLKYELRSNRIKAIHRRTEIKTYIDQTQLNFNKNLSTFIENIINEKKQMEDKILELENKINSSQSTLITQKNIEDKILELENKINSSQSILITQKNIEDKILELENKTKGVEYKLISEKIEYESLKLENKIINIINEKKQIEDKTLELENKLDNVILVLQKFGVSINY